MRILLIKPASVLLYTATLLLSSAAILANSGWTKHADIIELIPTDKGRYLVRLNISENPSGCRNKNTFYQDYGTRGADNMYLALLEAVKANKQVRVYVTGKCELNGYSEISSVGIVP
jgi:hypothetical protein